MNTPPIVQDNNQIPQQIAALDLGSNSFHLVIAAVNQGEVRIRDAISEKVQLGAGIDKNKNITAAAEQRALNCLERYSERLNNLPNSAVRIVGTNALRLAHNSDDFLAKAVDILGYGIDIIGGREEARLVYLGVSHTLADDEGSRLVIDIGGGSTEFIIGSRFEASITESLHMGCVSFARQFFSEQLSPHQFAKAVMAARLQLIDIKQELLQAGWQNCVGASGTIRSIYNILNKQGCCDDEVCLSGLYNLRDQVLSFSRLEDIQIEGLSDARALILPSGLAILIAIFESLKIGRMRYSTGALREGVLYDLLGRIQHEDVRDRTVQALMERYRVNSVRSRKIEVTALALLKHLGQSVIEDEKLIDFLGWAALLHQIGLSVSHSKFHNHGSYLIRYSDLPGFSKKEQTFLAAIIKNHRRKFSHAQNNSSYSHQSNDFEVFSVCLRLAVLLQHGDNDLDITELNFSRVSSQYVLKFPNQWIANNPLFYADLNQEIEYLQAADIQLAFL